MIQGGSLFIRVCMMNKIVINQVHQILINQDTCYAERVIHICAGLQLGNHSRDTVAGEDSPVAHMWQDEKKSRQQ